MGLEEGHPEKEGVLVDLSSLVDEVKARLARKSQVNVDALAQQLEGTKTEDAGV